MCDEAVDDCLAALKFVPDWFVTNKMIKIHFTALYADKNILYFEEDSGNVIFICNEVGILTTDLNTIIMMIKMNLILLLMLDFLAWHIKFEKCRALKKMQEKN